MSKFSRKEKPLDERNPNVIGASARPLYDKTTFVKTIREMIPGSDLLTRLQRNFEEGDLLLRENDSNDSLYIVLDGYVSQVKEGQEFNTSVDMQGPGDFIGLLSFQTGEPVFTSSKATTPVTTLVIDRDSFEIFLDKYPDISRTLQGLIFSNLAERYRRVVTLHVEVAHLSKELEKERNHLRKTIKELARTRNMLISQEKMATLGELTAGLAHEINNPASALLRSVEYLSENLPKIAERASALPDTGLVRYFFEAGLKRALADTAMQRDRMKQLSNEFPSLGRSKVRTIAEMDTEVFEKVKPYIKDRNGEGQLQLFIDAFQSGIYLNGIKLSTSRIEYLVKSLKSYSRHTGSEPEVVDIRNGIRETLLITGNRLKNFRVKVDLPEVPMVECLVGEMNQVWTNVIINACDAMKDKGTLEVSCGHNAEENTVWVKIADTGPGVPDKLKEKIFDSSFTTKTAGGDFGLGIGLAISKGIVEKHFGTIHVYDRQCRGAEFVVTLPGVK
jgi:signal transduction histidine kinase